MRLNECTQVKGTLQEHLGINLTIVDGSDLFLRRLAGVTEPEAKRKIIGGTCKPCSNTQSVDMGVTILTWMAQSLISSKKKPFGTFLLCLCDHIQPQNS